MPLLTIGGQLSHTPLLVVANPLPQPVFTATGRDQQVFAQQAKVSNPALGWIVPPLVSGFVGQACQFTCPAASGTVCSSHGVCAVSVSGTAAVCVCYADQSAWVDCLLHFDARTFIFS